MSVQRKLKKIYIKMLRAFAKKKMKKGNKHRQRMLEITATGNVIIQAKKDKK